MRLAKMTRDLGLVLTGVDVDVLIRRLRRGWGMDAATGGPLRPYASENHLLHEQHRERDRRDRRPPLHEEQQRVAHG
ncbi:hypothetical protein GCM10027057_04630 [Marisediminicola antarctica]